MDFSALPLGQLDQVALAVHDILHSDTWIRDAFGGRELAGTASIDPASTTLVGTSTFWSTQLQKGSVLVLGDQVAKVASVTSDTALEIEVAHADGLIDQTIAVAARGFRCDRADAPLSIALPYFTVAAGQLPSYEAGVGRLLTDPAIQITFFYAPSRHPIGDREGSWASLVQRVILRLKESDGVRLKVPRFGNLPLARGLKGAAAGVAILQGEKGSLYAPAMQVTFSGMNPAEAELLTQRW